MLQYIKLGNVPVKAFRELLTPPSEESSFKIVNSDL